MGWLDLILIALLLVTISIAINQHNIIKELIKNQEFIEKVKERLYETSEKVLNTENENEIYAAVLDAAVDLIPCGSKGSILTVDNNGDFCYRVVKGFHNDLVGMTLKRTEVYLYVVNKFKETAIIDEPRVFDETNTDIETIEELREKNALDIYCTISAPIYIDNKLIGLLNVDCTEQSYKFTKKELNLMNLLKSELQIAIKNAFAQNKLKYLANFDELTGVMNRRRFNLELHNEIEKLKKEKDKGFCLVLIDLDKFKIINDTYGHNFGDKVLIAFSKLLRDNIKTPHTVARLSGDEFVILFRNCSMSEIEDKMKKITEILSSKKLNDINLSFSYGIYESTDYENLTFEEAMILADTRMYDCKKLKSLAM